MQISVSQMLVIDMYSTIFVAEFAIMIQLLQIPSPFPVLLHYLSL